MKKTLADAILPIRTIEVVCQFQRASQLHFFHQPALTSFCYSLLEDKAGFDQYIQLDAVETGRTRYTAGDLYHFSISVLNGGRRIFDQLLSKLSELPQAAKHIDQRNALSSNLEFIECRDLLSGQQINHFDQITLYGEQSLSTEVDILRKIDSEYVLRCLTPFRIKRDKKWTASENPKGEARYCTDARHLSLTTLLEQISSSLFNFARLFDALFVSPSTQGVGEFTTQHLFWIHASYANKAGRYHSMGGLTGKISIPNNDIIRENWLPILVLGQYLAMGERKNFGWGRYRLEFQADEKSNTTMIRAMPAHSILVNAALPDNLENAWQIVEQNRAQSSDDVQNDDDEDLDDPLSSTYDMSEPQDAPTDLLNRLSERLASETYRAPCLKGYVIPKKDGSLRPLAVPPFSDRIAQRAVMQVMNGALEPFMAQSSHGYRKGHSRITAKDQVKAAFSQGYKWVYEADIEDFFNAIQREHLAIRLQALYSDDAVVPLIMDWMSAEVDYQGTTVSRPRGLPQGAPLSPLMANLMLDELDKDLKHAGFMLIRYADDFIVLCKTKVQAKLAEQRVAHSLQEIGLRINQDKSGIVSFEQGFKFLGYVFKNDLVLDTGKIPEHKTSRANTPKTKTTQQDNYWLSQIYIQRKAKPLEPEKIFATPKPEDSGSPTLDNIGAQEAFGLTLFVSGERTHLATRNNRLTLSRDNHVIAEYPWRNLQSVVIIGIHNITTPGLRTAMGFSVSIHFLNRWGYYQGIAHAVKPTTEGHQLWLQQMALFDIDDQALALAKAVISARLQNQRETLRRFDKLLFEKHRRSIQQILKKLPSVENTQALNGLEGNGASQYFAAIRARLPKHWAFKARTHRNAADPFNAMLDLGYTILYQYTNSLILVNGLYPWCGFMHQGRGDHYALASDMMEPFRHIVERVALDMLMNSQVKREDFEYNPQPGRMEIQENAKRAYLTKLSRQLNGGDTLKSVDRTTPLKALNDQIVSLRNHIRSGQPFRSWRLK